MNSDNIQISLIYFHVINIDPSYFWELQHIYLAWLIEKPNNEIQTIKLLRRFVAFTAICLTCAQNLLFEPVSDVAPKPCCSSDKLFEVTMSYLEQQCKLVMPMP